MRIIAFLPALIILLSAINGVGAKQAPTRNPPQGAAVPSSVCSARPQEDWNTLSLEKTHLRAKMPLSLGKKQYKTFDREMVQLEWRPFDPILLTIVTPHSAVKPPVVLFLYSYPTDTKRFLDAGYCERLAAQGYASVGFESALTGDRYRMRPMREWFVSELQESLACSTHDVQLVLNYLGGRGDLDVRKVGIFGQGSGGTIAILAASVDPRIVAIDLLNPWGDWEQWLAKSPLVPKEERSRFITKEFQSKLTAVEPLNYLLRLTKTKIRMQFVKSDPITPDVCIQKLMAAVPKTAEAVQYPGVVAFREGVGGGRLFAWLGQQMGTKPTAAIPLQKPPDKARAH